MCYRNCPAENYHGECTASRPLPCEVEAAFEEAEARAAGVETDITCPRCLDEAGEHNPLRRLDSGVYYCPCDDCERTYTQSELMQALSDSAKGWFSQSSRDNEYYYELMSLREFRQSVQRSLAATGTAA